MPAPIAAFGAAMASASSAAGALGATAWPTTFFDGSSRFASAGGSFFFGCGLGRKRRESSVLLV